MMVIVEWISPDNKGTMKSSTIHWNAPEGDKACLYAEELFLGLF